MINIHRSFISVVGVSLALIILASGLFLRGVSGVNDNDQTTQITPSAKNLLGAKLEQTYALDDFNGDGLMDVAVTDFLSDTVSVLAGDRAGYFHSVTRLSSGGGPRAMVAADFNRDGAVDLAVANFFSGDVAVFAGRGDGSFEQRRMAKLGEGLASLVGEDFDSDGSPDLAVANFLSGQVMILKGAADGSFAAPTLIGRVPAATLILSRDQNGDGLKDLIAFDAPGKEVRLFAGEGNGSFREAEKVEPAAVLSSEHNQKMATEENLRSGEVRAIRKLSGDGQSALAGFALPQPLAVEVNERDGQSVAGAQVAFSKLVGEAHWEEGDTRLTNEQGQASLTLSLEASPGNNLIATVLPDSAVNVFGALATLSSEAYVEKITAVLVQSSAAENNGTKQGELLAAIIDKLEAGDEVGTVESLTESIALLTSKLSEQSSSETSTANPVDLLKRLMNQVLLLGAASSVEAALPISCGETLSGNIGQAGQQDTYTF